MSLVLWFTKEDNVFLTFKNILTENNKIINSQEKFRLASKMALKIKMTSVFYVKKRLIFKVSNKLYLFNIGISK